MITGIVFSADSKPETMSYKSYSFTCDRDITVNFANVKLPHTGGIGYKLPVTIGIICVTCGGAFIAVGRKKKNDK